MSEQENPLRDLLDFVANAPEDEDIINMDCNDACEEMAALAEQVANGANLDEVLPRLKEFMNYWGHCREEFEALVAVIKAENAGLLDDFSMPDELDNKD